MAVLFKKSIFDGVANKEIVQQLESKKKCKNKLPTWFNTKGIYYPKKIHIEQTSSEITAKYKASLVDGASLLDFTGGLGVDSYFFSKKIDSITHLEINDELSSIAAYNFNVLKQGNITTICENGISYLQASKKEFDVIYLDPSRRNKAEQKVFLLSDCMPNVPRYLELLFKSSETILVKTSPLLDFSNGIQELKYVKQIHVVAIENEVKELLWLLEKGFTDDILIKTINIKKNENEAFDFKFLEENKATTRFDTPLKYLYEPNAAILKSGAFRLLGEKLNLSKLHEHTHLYTSVVALHFPGRCFNIVQTVPYNKKAIKTLGLKKANITTRNFPESVLEIRKKSKIKDGGFDYLFFCTNKENNLIVIHCRKN
ncbi:THUMP-like domain-containing protein [Costertonia aggregata]|nr:class I SAM-dependent methyltransferase [Costertonia aggregata]